MNTPTMNISTEITLTAPNVSPMGRERVRLLEAVARAGSISGAAREMGVTYKTAWDAICAMNNLVGRSLVETQTGGKRGGGARLTDDGMRLIETFHKLEAEMARVVRSLGPDLDNRHLSVTGLLGSGYMRTSARNALRGTVMSVMEDAVNVEVALRLSDEARLVAVITRGSLLNLGLVPGRSAIALIKASFVTLAPADAPEGRVVRGNRPDIDQPGINRIEGTITNIEEGALNTEVALDVGGGKTLTAVGSLGGIRALGLAPGARAVALIDPNHIILAVD